MVNLNITLPEDFLKEEFRDEYYISSKMKELWAIELDLLAQFSAVCTEHQLKWFIDGGSLLGAVRHGGYIPWDDDIDIVMFREDYEKFLTLAHFEEPYFLQNYHTEGKNVSLFSKLRNSNTRIETSLRNDNNLVANKGICIDIFPIDNVPEDNEKRLSFYKDIQTTLHQAKDLRNQAISVCVTDIYDDRIKHQMEFCDEIIKSYKEATSIKSTIALSIRHPKEKEWLYHTEDYSETIMLPFEFLQVPAPKNYERMLIEHYGENWATPLKVKGQHTTYYFDTNNA